jgi:hypothetical protein
MESHLENAFSGILLELCTVHTYVDNIEREFDHGYKFSTAILLLG